MASWDIFDWILGALGRKRSRPLFAREFAPAAHPLRAALDDRYAALRYAMSSGDSSAIAGLLATDFVSVDVRGKVIDGHEMIASVLAVNIDRSKRTAVTTLVSVEESDGLAVVLQHYRMESSPDAPRSMPRRLQTLSRDTWRRIDGAWLIKRTETLEVEVQTSDGVHRYQRADNEGQRVKKPPPQEPTIMDESQFWELIEASKSPGDDIDTQVEKLISSLVKLPAGEIVDFAKQFDRKMANSYTWDLWAAAYIIGGGCSDDGFDYFRGWLIVQGRKVFDGALRDPESLVDIADPDADAESVLYVASEAYERKTGGGLPEFKRTVASRPSGAKWDEENVNEKFPGLAARFSG